MARETRRSWAERVRRWKASGLRAIEFAEFEGVNARTLVWWRWRLSARGRARRATLARAPSTPMEFVEVVAPAAGGRSEPFEVEVDRGWRLRVPSSFESGALERLLGVLEGRR